MARAVENEFTIDAANSENKLEILSYSEFGYLSRRLGFSSTANLHDTIAEQMRFAAGLWDIGLPPRH